MGFVSSVLEGYARRMAGVRNIKYPSALLIKQSWPHLDETK